MYTLKSLLIVFALTILINDKIIGTGGIVSHDQEINSCENGVKDADETDVDCGNNCFALCNIGMRCVSDFDCSSWKCGTSHKCIEDKEKMRFLSSSGASGGSAPTTTATTSSSTTTVAPKSKGKCLPGGWIDNEGKCRACPVGHYCNPRTMESPPTKCPSGTWSDKLNSTSIQNCVQCPARTFGDEEGLDEKKKCKPCGFGSNSKPGAKKCSLDVVTIIIILICVGAGLSCIIYPMFKKGMCNCLPCCYVDPKFSKNELKAASVVPVPPPPRNKDFNLP
jgi:hypothetical protein